VAELMKQKIRNYLLEQRKNFNETLYINANEVVSEKVLNLIHLLSTKDTIGFYWPFVGEPNLLQIMSLIGNEIGLPYVTKDNMYYVRYKIGDALEQGKFSNFYYPTQKVKIIPKIIIIPGLSFSISGYRLGFGKGYYDKYLIKASSTQEKPIAIGVCFHDNLVLDLPFNDRDYKLNYIITDEVTIRT
jgi:5-formyltetrahydrofolate cyclo-ligase